MKRAIFAPEAEVDAEEALLKYEAARLGLGREFMNAVEACVAAIERTPGRFRFANTLFRCVRLRRFPYTIYYILDEDGIEISACLHHKRGSAVLEKRTRVVARRRRRRIL